MRQLVQIQADDYDGSGDDNADEDDDDNDNDYDHEDEDDNDNDNDDDDDNEDDVYYDQCLKICPDKKPVYIRDVLGSIGQRFCLIFGNHWVVRFYPGYRFFIGVLFIGALCVGVFGVWIRRRK